MVFGQAFLDSGRVGDATAAHSAAMITNQIPDVPVMMSSNV